MNKNRFSIKRNSLDYILTDTMPVEVSELFSYVNFYNFLLSNNKLKKIAKHVLREKASNKEILFGAKDGHWQAKPLSYYILKDCNGSLRNISLLQPLSILNLYFFVIAYEKELLETIKRKSLFSVRYQSKNNDLFYKCRSKGLSKYFSQLSKESKMYAIQQVGNYFKIKGFSSISTLINSRYWSFLNLHFKYFAKADYKECFSSIYTHSFKWIVSANVSDSKAMKNSNLYVVIDRILQNINGYSSNGIIVGPEFSRMIAEILLQEIDFRVKNELITQNLYFGKNYVVLRFVDDFFIFANSPETISLIIKCINKHSLDFLLKLNENKTYYDNTPVILNKWLCDARAFSDKITNLFYKRNEIINNDKIKCIFKNEFVFYQRYKDDFISILKKNINFTKYIVSFSISTFLNCVSTKKIRKGITIFDLSNNKDYISLLDLVLYIYSFAPNFDNSQKVISIIYYLSEEIDFTRKNDSFLKLLKKYSFIFIDNNLNDLCNWFPTLSAFNLSLDVSAEEKIIKKIQEEDNPLLWANLLVYSQYSVYLKKEISEILNNNIRNKMIDLFDKDIFMNKDFWYILIFINCPYIDKNIVVDMKTNLQKVEASFLTNSNIATDAQKLIISFLTRNNDDCFFSWKVDKHFVKKIYFRTYERTIFKKDIDKNFGISEGSL